MIKLEKYILLIVIIAIVSTLVPIVSYINTFGFNLSHEHSTWAESGDFFGGIINPILGFLSFIALLVTINIQIKEHRATIQELEETKKIHSEQSIIFSNQNLEIIKDKYEKQFFQLIDIFNRSEEKIEYRSEKGSSAFSQAERNIQSLLERSWEKSNEQLLSTIQSFFNDYINNFDPYFKNLMFIINFILNLKRKNILDVEEIEFYFSTVRSQLTNKKMNFIFYACLVNPHPDLSKEKIKESKLLMNISISGFIKDVFIRYKDLTTNFY